MCATVFHLVGRIGFHIYEANIHSMKMKYVFTMEKYY